MSFVFVFISIFVYVCHNLLTPLFVFLIYYSFISISNTIYNLFVLQQLSIPHLFHSVSVCVCMRGVYVIQLGFPFFVKICLHLSFVSEFHSTAADLLTLACVHFCVSFQFAV